MDDGNGNMVTVNGIYKLTMVPVCVPRGSKKVFVKMLFFPTDKTYSYGECLVKIKPIWN